MNKVQIPDGLKFIDNHTHGSFGVNFNYGSYDEIKFVLKELYKRNIKGICPTLVGETNENIKNQLAIFKKIRDEQIKSIDDEALILGVHLEGSFLNPDKSGIQDKKVFLAPNIENFKNLTGEYQDIIKIVTIAPELDMGLIDYLIDCNIKPQAGHTMGEYLKGCLALTHTFNAMNPIHHRNPSVLLEGLTRDDIYTEVIADLFHLSCETLKLIKKTKPIDKILLVSDSLPSSNYDGDVIFCGKKLDKFGKDITGTIAGSNMTLDEICAQLLQKNIFSVDEILKIAFYNQINYLNAGINEIDILNR